MKNQTLELVNTNGRVEIGLSCADVWVGNWISSERYTCRFDWGKRRTEWRVDVMMMMQRSADTDTIEEMLDRVPICVCTLVQKWKRKVTHSKSLIDTPLVPMPALSSSHSWIADDFASRWCSRVRPASQGPRRDPFSALRVHERKLRGS